MRNANGVTHTAYVRGAVFGNDEHQVVWFTGLTLNELYDFEHDMGRRWMQVLFTNNGMEEGDGLDWWEEKEIMQVWHLHWRKIDHEMIVPILHSVEPEERENTYREMHYTVFQQSNPYCVYLAMAMMRTMKRMCKDAKVNSMPPVINGLMAQL